MTESLLQQARQLRVLTNGAQFFDAERKQFAEFLNAVIPFLEEHEKFYSTRLELQKEPDHQRTHTLAIMAATIWVGLDPIGNSVGPVYADTEDDRQDRLDDAIGIARKLLAEVEKRNP